IRGVPVDDQLPFGDPTAVPPTDGTVNQTLQLTVPDFDVAGAMVTVGDAQPIPYGTGMTIGTRPGDVVEVTVEIDPAGSISGTVEGYSWVRGDLPTVADFGDPGQLLVYARRVDFTETTDPSGNRIYERKPPPPPPSEFDWVLVDRTDPTDLSFDFSAAPGFYEFRFEHPDYRQYELLAGGAPEGDIRLSDGGQLFEMVNKRNNAISTGAFGLQLLPATLDLNLWSAFDPDDSGANVGIDGLAEMRVILLDGSPSGVPIGPNNSYDVDQSWPVSAANPTLQLQPGNYRLEMFKQVNGQDQVYPLTIGITLNRNGLRVDATLPSLNFELWVMVTVVNSAWTASEDEDSPNRLPVPDGISLTRSWEAPDALLTGGGTTTLVPNSSPPLPGTSGRYLSETITTGDQHNEPDVYKRVVKFTGIPSGDHDIQVSVPPSLQGYVPITAEWLDVSVPESDTDAVTRLELILEVQDVDVNVTITGADDDQFPAATAHLSYSGISQAIIDQIPVVRSDPKLITLTSVPPRRGNYLLSIDDELHESKNVLFAVAVDATRSSQPDPSPQIVPTDVTADKGRLEMKLRLEETNGGCTNPLGDLPTPTCLALPDGGPGQADGGVVKIDDAEVAHTGGFFTRDFTAAEPSTTHTLFVSNGDAYEEYDESVIVPLGRIINPVPEVKLRKLARINVSITGADPANVVIATSVAPSLVNA
ncbi:MAG: hypothetical protein OEZ14_16370, partial [Acidimicrobiia bacterium]|nr:hypothetical protein [Acidimicrobiia bacterium]